MSKKLTFGKLAGIIFCILAAAGAIVLLCANIYFGGQMKAIDKYFTALERNDFKSYMDCVPKIKTEYFPEKGEFEKIAVTEKDFDSDRNGLAVLQDNEKLRVKPSFVKREKMAASRYGKYVVTIDLTVYNESEQKTFRGVQIVLIRSDGKWFLEK